MDILEQYKKLSNEDKRNLNRYCIFNSIYDVARNENFDISDELVLEIQEISYDLSLEDEDYNLSETQISDFITTCYIKDNDFLEKLNDMDYSNILGAINDNDSDFYKELEQER